MSVVLCRYFEAQGDAITQTLPFYELCLVQVLEAQDDKITQALPLYEQRRAPDLAALVQLMTFCFPWQVRFGGGGGVGGGGGGSLICTHQ